MKESWWVAINKFKKSQVVMLFLLAALLIAAPFLSSSLRPKYLYLIINLLIIALGAEAGLLSSLFSKPILEEKKHYFPVSSTNHQPPSSPNSLIASTHENKNIKVMEKSVSEKIVGPVKVVGKVKRCPSMPSLFFIGGEVADSEPLPEHHLSEEDEQEEEIGEISDQELFTKAENFIGNFYKQLKIQREESWKRIYQKAF